MMVWGCISTDGMDDLNTCEGTIDAEVNVGILETHMMPSIELHVHFRRIMTGLILQELQQRGFIGIECVCLTGLPEVQICLLLKMYSTS